MNMLILGGSGFLSGELARTALADGHQVWTLTRGQRRLPEGVTCLQVDRQDREAFARVVRHAAQKWDLVVDCIAFSPEDIEQDVACFTDLTRHLVFVSTDFVYDPEQRRLPQGEQAAAYLQAGYGGQKRRAELALAAAAQNGLPWSIVRPTHIYGPGSQLGCLPQHSRDDHLIERLRKGEALELVGGGYFLQQPLLAHDLAHTILSLAGEPAALGQILNVAGPEMVEARAYYRIIANILGVELTIREIPVEGYLQAHPEAAVFLCHRIYDLARLQATGAYLPATPLAEGLQAQVDHLLG